MLTKCKVEKILCLVGKEYDYMYDRPIHIIIDNELKWSVGFTPFDYTLRLSEEFDDDDFTIFFYEYLIKEFNFDSTWAETYYQTTITALVLLHEIGHIQQTMNINIDKYFIQRVNEKYKEYMEKTASMDEEEQAIEYRKISYEYLADKFAIDIFNKYAVKILAILNGTTQKEIKNRLAEVKKEVV